MKMNLKNKKAGVFFAALSIVLIILVGLYSTGILQPIMAKQNFVHDHLSVDTTYLLKTSESNDSVNVTCIPYITNIWEKESGIIKIIVYVIETKNNLAVYKNTVEIGTIPADSTAEIEIPIILSNNSYKVDILIFEDEKLVIKGILNITARSILYWDDIQKYYKQEWDVTNSLSSYMNFH